MNNNIKLSRTFRLEKLVIQLLEELSQDKQFNGNNTKALEHAVLKLAESRLGEERVKEIIYSSIVE